MGQGLRRASHSQARLAYWAGSKVSPSSPSSSTPTESLLQLLREQSQHIGNIETELEQARAAVQELKMVQRAKLMRLGGAAWVRQQIERSPEPLQPPATSRA